MQTMETPGATGQAEAQPGSARPRIVGITEPAYRDHDIESALLRPCGAEVRRIDWQGDKAKLHQMLPDLDVLMVRDLPLLDAEAIACMRPGTGIVRYGVGVDNIDLEAAKQRQIKVANVPDYGADIEVSDHAVALTLALMRRIVSRDTQVRDGRWNIAQKEPIYRIADSVLGLVGFGKIARAYLTRMRVFGIQEVLVFDPYVSDQLIVEFGAKRATIDEICRAASIISLHAPVTPETRQIIDASALALMNEKTCLINTSRGGLVDTAALAAAIRAGKIFGAALDVLDQEPIVADCPLRGLDNVILTDHTGWYSEASVRALQTKAAQAAVEMLTTGTPQHWINKW